MSELSRPRLCGLGAAPFEAPVIGGGILGASVTRDAALRGLRTSWRFCHPNQAEMSDSACVWMADDLGWNAGRKHSVRERYSRMAEFIEERS